MKKFVSKLLNEAHSLIWTIAGTALVLITLSGQVREMALQISILALIFHLFGVIVKREKD